MATPVPLVPTAAELAVIASLEPVFHWSDPGTPRVILGATDFSWGSVFVANVADDDKASMLAMNSRQTRDLITQAATNANAYTLGQIEVVNSTITGLTSRVTLAEGDILLRNVRYQSNATVQAANTYEARGAFAYRLQSPNTVVQLRAPVNGHNELFLDGDTALITVAPGITGCYLDLNGNRWNSSISTDRITFDPNTTCEIIYLNDNLGFVLKGGVSG